MDRVYQSNTVATPPDPPASVGGFPARGDPTIGRDPTVPGAFWFHAVTEEIRNAVIQLGGVPNKNAVNQLAAGLAALVRFTPQTLTEDQKAQARKNIGADNIGGVVVESWKSSTSWYRLYSDGWLEQGGVTPAMAFTSRVVTLPRSYGNIDYHVMTTPWGAGTDGNWDEPVNGGHPESASTVRIYEGRVRTGPAGNINMDLYWMTYGFMS